MTPSRRELLPLAAALAGTGVSGFPAAAQGAGDVSAGTTLGPGIHRINANTTIKGDLLLQPGASIEVAAGRTLTLLGGLVAPVSPIFTGPGRVDLNRARISHAHPEWWGAAPGDPARDSLPAFLACLAAHPAMRLLPADYYIADTLALERPFARIEGEGFRGTGPYQGTRLIVTSGSADVLRLGPATRPPSINDFPQNIEVRSLALARSVPVEGGAAGLTAQFLLFARVEHVSAFEHAIGFAARGLVRGTLADCVAFRSLPGRQRGSPWRGFLLDGTADIGLAGGNASLFLDQCNATIGGEPAVGDAVGLLLDGAFADSFVSGFETAGVPTGIRVDGRTAMLGGRARNGHINLHVTMPVIDQCARAGIEVRDTAPEAVIDLVQPYVATANGATAALWFRDHRGQASVSGGQLVAAPGSRSAGLLAANSRGLQVSGLKVLDQARPAELAGCEGFALGLSVASPGGRPGGAGVSCRDCAGGTISLLLSGQPGAFAAGLRVEGRGARLRVDATGIDPVTVGERVVAGGRAAPVPSRSAGLVVDGL